MNKKDLAHKYANEVAEKCLAQRLRVVGRIVSNRDGHRADRRRRLGFSLNRRGASLTQDWSTKALISIIEGGSL